MGSRRYARFVVISLSFTLGACGGAAKTKSRFYAGFSAKDVIEKGDDLSKGWGELRVESGETSALLGSGRIYHRDDRADLRISESDEPSFLPRIRGEIEQQLLTNGIKITDAGSGENKYSIGYTDGTVRGWIDIWGVRRMGDSYTLVITMTEF